MEPEDITAWEFLAAADSATRNGVDKPPFRATLAQLKLLPHVRERLLFEFIQIATKALEEGCDPLFVVIWVDWWHDAISEPKQRDFLMEIERLILLAATTIFDGYPSARIRMPATRRPMVHSIVDRLPTRFSRIETLRWTLLSVRRSNEVRYLSLADELLRRSTQAPPDVRKSIRELLDKLDGDWPPPSAKNQTPG